MHKSSLPSANISQADVVVPTKITFEKSLYFSSSKASANFLVSNSFLSGKTYLVDWYSPSFLIPVPTKLINV